MLVELCIRNIAVIEEVRLQCGEGFHVLTGETGAGKSMIIDALLLVAGGRGSIELIRYGCERAEVEAVFELPPPHRVWQTAEKHGIRIDAGEQLIIRRELTSQGKSFSRVNGQTVTLAVLREISESLVNIHGQHEHQSLFKTELHVEWLDLFGGEVVLRERRAYAEQYKMMLDIQKRLKELQENERQARQMSDLYRFQLEEIRSAKLKVNEDERHESERRKLANAERLHGASEAIIDSLNGQKGALAEITLSLQKLRDIAKYDSPFATPLLEQLESAYFQAEDVAFQIRDYRDSIEFNPARLQQLEKRLDLISQLKKKYGSEISDILTYEAQIASKLEQVDRHDELLEQLQSELNDVTSALRQCAERLSAARQSVAGHLAEQILEQLKHLQMERSRFVVSIEPLTAFQKHGLDAVEFLFSANPGEPARPLAKVASGGECSRLMLAIKTIFAQIEEVPVLVFDEVDTGVSGRAAQSIAEKMAEVATHCQVFAITHLPQVACAADIHYLIDKQVREDRTVTIVTAMSHEMRIEELARMLGGTAVTDKTREHAGEMLSMASRANQ